MKKIINALNVQRKLTIQLINEALCLYKCPSINSNLLAMLVGAYPNIFSSIQRNWDLYKEQKKKHFCRILLLFVGTFCSFILLNVTSFHHYIPFHIGEFLTEIPRWLRITATFLLLGMMLYRLLIASHQRSEGIVKQSARQSEGLLHYLACVQLIHEIGKLTTIFDLQHEPNPRALLKILNERVNTLVKQIQTYEGMKIRDKVSDGDNGREPLTHRETLNLFITLGVLLGNPAWSIPCMYIERAASSGDIINVSMSVSVSDGEVGNFTLTRKGDGTNLLVEAVDKVYGLLFSKATSS